MKKLFTTLALATMAVFGASAGTLLDYFNNSIRPKAAIIQEAPAAELANSGLKSSTVAVVDATAIEEMMATKFAAPAEKVVEATENGASVAIWKEVNGEEAEVLLFAKSPQGSVAIYANGPESALQQFMNQ